MLLKWGIFPCINFISASESFSSWEKSFPSALTVLDRRGYQCPSEKEIVDKQNWSECQEFNCKRCILCWNKECLGKEKPVLSCNGLVGEEYRACKNKFMKDITLWQETCPYNDNGVSGEKVLCLDDMDDVPDIKIDLQSYFLTEYVVISNFWIFKFQLCISKIKTKYAVYVKVFFQSEKE